MREIFIPLVIVFFGFLLFLYLGSTTITFSPFSIKIKDPLYASGWILMCAGMALIISGSRIKGYMEGYEDGVNDAASITITKNGVEKGSIIKINGDGK